MMMMMMMMYWMLSGKRESVVLKPLFLEYKL